MVNTTFYRNGQVIENRAQRVTGNVGQALVARSSAYLEMLAVAHQNDCTPEMRQESSELRRRVTRNMSQPDPNFEQLEADLRDAALKRSDQISAILTDRITARDRIWITERSKWIDLFVSPPVDHSFWWAQTQPHLAPDTRAEFRDDGLHFWGGPKVNTYDGEMHTSFGAVASFALQPERFPKSPSGTFLSSAPMQSKESWLASGRGTMAACARGSRSRLAPMIVLGSRRSWRIATADRSMSNGRGSC